MSKRKHTPEWMIARVEEYLSGKGSCKSIARAYGIGYKTLRNWIYKYRELGTEAFAEMEGNKKYSKEFKIYCVEAVLRGEGSVDAIISKYNISSRSVLQRWIKKYNANMELKDYDPKREVYMADAKRKTTLEERKVYTWVKKYVADGEAGLTDRRGHHKTDEEVDELELLRRENLRLKRQLEERDMLVELLKKVKEFEGR